jgi:hypothetical protein
MTHIFSRRHAMLGLVVTAAMLPPLAIRALAR